MRSLEERINELVGQMRVDAEALPKDTSTLLEDGEELLESGEANAYKSILYLHAIMQQRVPVKLTTLAEKLLANLLIEAVEKPEYDLSRQNNSVRNSYDSVILEYEKALTAVESNPTELALGNADSTLELLKDWMDYFKSESLFDNYYDCENRYNTLSAAIQTGSDYDY